MKAFMSLSEIILLTGLACLSGGCEKKEEMSVPQTQPVSHEESLEDTPTSVATLAEQIQPLQVGAMIPKVTLRKPGSEEIGLRSLISEKPTVLVFYRGGWCPYCNTQLGHLKGIEQQIIDAGWQIIAVSPDRLDKLSETIEKHQMKYTLLSDSKMQASIKFGIAFKVDDGTVKKYRGYGIDLNDASGQSHHMLPVPAIFLVGTDGIIKFTYANPDYKIRLDTQILLSEIKTMALIQ